MMKSRHEDNQIRAAIALSECLRLKMRSSTADLDEAKRLIVEAMQIARRNDMSLHRMDCEFEKLMILARTEGVAKARRGLVRLYRKARGYGLLRSRIGNDLKKMEGNSAP